MDERSPLLAPGDDASGESPLLLPEGGTDQRPNEAATGTGEFVSYRRRWYILFIYSLLAFTQSLCWNSWGPIATSAKLAYGWTNGMISLLAAWGPIMFMSTVFIYSWLIETKGLRWASLAGTGFLTLGTGIRCVTTQAPYVTWLTNLGQICCGAAGPLAMVAQTAISVTWFPPSQHSIATALSGSAMGLGVGISFILGPWLVTVSKAADFNESTSSNRTNLTIASNVRDDIQGFLFTELAWATLVFVAIIVYFPAKPPTPPNHSMCKEDFNLKDAVTGVLSSSYVWLLGLPFSVAFGVMLGWSAVLDLNLQPQGISQIEAGWIGLCGSSSAVVAKQFLARVGHVLRKKTKLTLILLCLVATVGTLIFALGYSKYIPYTKPCLYSGAVFGAACVSAMAQFVFEILPGKCSTVSERVTNTALALMISLSGLIFLAILWIPGVGTMWINMVFVGCVVLCIPFGIAFRERHERPHVL